MMVAECFICAEVYNKEERRPRQLSCGHPLCTRCAAELLKENEPKCYVCRVSLKASNATELPIDFVLDALVDESSASNEQILCSQCDDPADPAEHICQECGYLCAFHNTNHSKSKALKSHVVQALKELDSTQLRQPIVACAKHHEPLKLFCQACRVVVCLECCVVEHDGHKRIEARSLSALIQNNQFNLIQESTKKEAQLQTGINEIKSMEHRIKAKCDEIEQQFTRELVGLNVVADQIKKNIQLRQAALKNSISKIRNQKLKMLENQREGIENATAALNKCKERVAASAASGMHIQTGVKAQYLATVIKSVNDRKLDLKPYAEAHDIIEYDAPANITDELKVIAQKLEQYGRIEDVDFKVQAERQWIKIEEQRKAPAEIERPKKEQPQKRVRDNFKYSNNVRIRNRIDPPISGAAGLHGQHPLTTERFADMTQEDQKRSLGDRIFMQVQPQQPDLAGKITGMLLDLDNSELLHLLEHPQFLEQKVQEAISVLEQHSKAQGSDGQ